MYCPNCSQQQVSVEVRFCSRCGFSLSAVRELMVGGGAPVERTTEAQAWKLARNRRSVRKGAGMMLSSLPLALIVGLMAAINDGFAVFVLVPFFCFVIGFARVSYGVFIAEKRALRVKDAVAVQPHGVPLMPVQVVGGDARRPELSPWAAAAAGSFTPLRAETAEMVRPPSVAEGTTRLLDEEADPQRR